MTNYEAMKKATEFHSMCCGRYRQNNENDKIVCHNNCPLLGVDGERRYCIGLEKDVQGVLEVADEKFKWKR